MLERIIETLCDTFTDDPSTPSVVLSKLKGGENDGKWYGSLVRYTERFGNGKQVVFKCCHDTLDEVLVELAEQLGVIAFPEDKATGSEVDTTTETE